MTVQHTPDKGVQEHEFENLKTARSVGSYFNRNYKNVYPYERA
ncbi:MAG: KTSC domain-containing protein [Chlorobium sp.]|nr:KTSC domain-containing protein [Chlorobium sp.]